MTRRRRSLSFLCVLAVVGAALVGVRAAATEALGDLFRVGVSARALGMGGAFTALAEDEAGVLYNPAKLAGHRGLGLSSLYASQFGGVTQGSVIVAGPYVGGGIVFLDSGLIDDGEDGFRYASRAALFGVGVPVGPAAMGVGWRFLSVATPFTGSGWALDAAVALDIEFLHVGLVYEAVVSAPMAYDGGAREEWDSGLRFGVATSLSPAEGVVWTASFDGTGLLGPAPGIAAGVEAWVGGVGARVGYDGAGMTFGLSARFVGLEVDWAYAARDDLGDSHRITLALRF
ncbi:MAG: hypothetical protein PHV11_00680 [Candidatus Bipolaricaulis sp.]|nr:hypothetical protein [Candidatus Bipolaricaulis sp.]MDD5645833.1 hypothetical protein [Candidatus Bipolaricaulis sp.]